jgi:hypothetical protein
MTPRHEPEVMAANRRQRLARCVLVGVAAVLFTAFALAQIGWMVASLFG